MLPACCPASCSSCRWCFIRLRIAKRTEELYQDENKPLPRYAFEQLFFLQFVKVFQWHFATNPIIGEDTYLSQRIHLKCQPCRKTGYGRRREMSLTSNKPGVWICGSLHSRPQTESSGFSPKDEKRPFGPIPKKLVIKTVLSLVFWCQKLQSFKETMWFVTDSFSWCRDLQHTENESTSLAKSFGVPRAPLAGNRRKAEIWGIERSLSTARKKCSPSCGFVWIFASRIAFYSAKSWYVGYVQLFSINVTTRYIYTIPDITSGGIGAPAGQWSLNPATGWSGSGQWLDDDLHELDDQDTSWLPHVVHAYVYCIYIYICNLSHKVSLQKYDLCMFNISSEKASRLWGPGTQWEGALGAEEEIHHRGSRGGGPTTTIPFSWGILLTPGST